jgi:uncharacterized protein YcbK (DUF882 family)
VGGFSRPVRAGYCVSLAALLLAIGCNSLQNATANGDTRTISFRSTHVKEELTVTYKVNGRYDEEALKKINQVLRDWREDKPTRMDPHLIDLIWEVHREVGATEPIAIVCGYRSPGTNAMLRRRSNGVAKFSQHMLGKALDFYIPGVPLEKLREAGLRASRGGVGFYPSSNFVHLDTGGVRHWPRMPEAQLARVMAKGPLSSSSKETRVAAARIPNPLAKLFGGAQEEDAETVAATTTTARPAAQKSAPKTEKTAERPVTVAAVAPAPVPTPAARPAVRPAPQPATAQPTAQPATFEMASATSRPVQLRPAQAASLVNRSGTSADGTSANSVISERGFWQGLPDAEALQASVAGKSPARRPAGTTVAAADSQATGNIGPWQVDRELSSDTLAYGPANHPAAKAQPPATATARQAPAQLDTTVAVKRTGTEPTLVSSPGNAPAGPAKVGQKFNDPWMRAMIVAPSAGGFMSTGLLGPPDYRVLSPYLRKPESSVMMTFAQDPHLGMTTTNFAGTAVVFVSTVTFSQRTAALR